MLVYIDLETTGFSFRKDHIIEVGAICLEEKLNILVNTNKPLSTKIVKLTGISRALLNRDSVSSTSACIRTLEWLGKHKPFVLVGHNIQLFDLPFLMMFFHRHGILDMFQPVGIIDTLLIFKQDKTLKSRKLGNIYSMVFNKPLSGGHRAWVDAEALKQIAESSWFETRYGDIKQYVKPYQEMISIFWERYIRLAKLTEYRQYCHVCQGHISPYFRHFHIRNQS